MQSMRVVEVLRGHESQLREFGISSLRLFGSTARDEAEAGSDVDVLLETSAQPRLGLRFLETLEELGEELGAPVNFSFPEAMQPWLRQRIEAEAIQVF